MRISRGQIMYTEIILKEQNKIVYSGEWNKELFPNKILNFTRGNKTKVISINIIKNKRYVLVSTDLSGGIA